MNFQDTTPELLRAADVIGIGSPTYMHTMHVQMKKFLDRLHSMHGKKGVAFGSYGWSGEAPWHIANKMRELGIDVLDPVVRVQYEPDEKETESCKLLGKDVAMTSKKYATTTIYIASVIEAAFKSFVKILCYRLSDECQLFIR